MTNKDSLFTPVISLSSLAYKETALLRSLVVHGIAKKEDIQKYIADDMEAIKKAFATIADDGTETEQEKKALSELRSYLWTMAYKIGIKAVNFDVDGAMPFHLKTLEDEELTGLVAEYQ